VVRRAEGGVMHVVGDVVRILRSVVLSVRWFTSPLVRLALRRRVPPAEVGYRLRRFFEEQGVMYIKLGQFLASRFDLLPREVCDELSRLFEAAPPLELGTVHELVERELGRPLAEAFAEIDPVPVGSASIAQVHRARTTAGDDVAIKIQRPRVAEIFDADIRNLGRLARAVDALALARGYEFSDLVDEFASFTRREMDFLTEAATMDRLRAQGDDDVVIPKVYEELTTSRLLVMDFFEGISYARAIALVDSGRAHELERLLPGVSLGAVSERIARTMLRQIFIDGFFQADPHPGNILIRRDGAVALIDFGIFGSLTEEKRKHVLLYIENLVLGNIDEAYHHYRRLLVFTSASDAVSFKREAKAVLRRYYAATRDPTTAPEERHVARFGDALGRLLYTYHVRLDLETLLFWRALFVLDATFVRPIDSFDLQTTLESFFLSAQPKVAERLLTLVEPQQLGTTIAAATLLPRRIETRLQELRSGRLRLQLELLSAPSARTRSDHAVSLVALGTAATAVGLALVATNVLVPYTLLAGTAAAAVVLARELVLKR
jgi:ubiquinone biosynthesis protein